LSAAIEDRTLGDDPAVEALAAELERNGGGGARLAVVLGSGLDAFAAALERPRTVATRKGPQVPGHAGRVVAGELAGTRILVQQGRVHLYQGFGVHEVTRTVRAFARLGVAACLLTNAAGGLVRAWPPGTLMRLVDHLDLQGNAPLSRAEAGACAIYDERLGAALERAAAEVGVELRAGVYAGVAGPSYETPAEIRALAGLGAHAVGMSTVAEAVAARAAGMRVAAVSCITNHAAGVGTGPLRHEDVLAVGRAASRRFVGLLERAVPELANA